MRWRRTKEIKAFPNICGLRASRDSVQTCTKASTRSTAYSASEIVALLGSEDEIIRETARKG